MNTSVKQRQGGFTMIEVMIVLGISGLLLLITFFGQGNIRTQAQFQDSVESLRSKLERLKDEVTTTASTTNDGCPLGISAGGDNANCVQFGKAVRFSDGSSLFRTSSIGGDGPAQGDPDPIVPVIDPFEFNVANLEMRLGNTAVINAGSPTTVVFTRHTGTGSLQTYVLTQDDGPLDAQATYTTNNPGSEGRITLVGPDCDRADLVINDPANTIRIEHQGRSCD